MELQEGKNDATARASYKGSGNAFVGASKPRNKAAISRTRVVFQHAKPVENSLLIKQSNAAAVPAVVAVNVEEAQNRSSDGRVITLPQRFKQYMPKLIL
jgi:hypothetical protein